MIKRRKVDTKVERQMLVGMIVNKTFLRDVRGVFDPDLIEAPYVRTVAEWCLDHFDQYEDAPGLGIGDVFDAKVRRKLVPESERAAIAEFLETLSEEHAAGDGKYNAEFWLDETETYLDAQSMRMRAEDVQALVSVGDLGKARALLQDHRQVVRATAQAVDPMGDKDAITKAFEAAGESLFTMPGALGKFVNPLLVRESLIGIMAPEKRGKTWLVQEFEIQAAKAGCNVVFFAVGDMTVPQMVRRHHVRLTGKNYVPTECGPTRVPVYDCAHNQTDECGLDERTCDHGVLEFADGKRIRTDYEEATANGYVACDVCRRKRRKAYKGAVWWKEGKVDLLDEITAHHAGAVFRRRYGDRIRLFSYEARALTPDVMERDLQQLAEDGFVADVVIADYPDNMDCDERVEQERHRQNNIWLGLNAVRKRWSACVIVPTQTDAAAYGRANIGMHNFNEDKRKLSHCTAMLAMNQTDEEKEDGILRLGLVLAREQEFTVGRQVRLIQHLKSGKPIKGSFF